MIPEVVLRRAVCERCRRPTSVCYCAHLVSLETQTRVILLQHPREKKVPVGTARLAHLCLPGSELHVGLDFDNDAQVRAALTSAETPADGPRRPAYLLFPGPNAIDLAEARPAGPITLVVVDGTWWQARKLLKRNALLASLPQIRFTPPAPSNYRIRREPAEHCVATVEALAEVLGRLEGAPERFATLLRPFEAMIDTQIHYATTVRGARRRHALHRTRRARRPSMASTLRERGDKPGRVCVHGEANAWPARKAGRAPGGDRPLDRQPPRHRRDLRGDHRAAPPAGAGDPAPHPDSGRAAGGGRELGFVLSALGGVRAARRLRLQLGTISARPAGGRRDRAAPARASTCGPWRTAHLGARTGSVEDCTTRLGVGCQRRRSPPRGVVPGWRRSPRSSAR